MGGCLGAYRNRLSGGAEPQPGGAAFPGRAAPPGTVSGELWQRSSQLGDRVQAVVLAYETGFVRPGSA